MQLYNQRSLLFIFFKNNIIETARGSAWEKLISREAYSNMNFPLVVLMKAGSTEVVQMLNH